MDNRMIEDAGYITGSKAANRLSISRQHFYRIATRLRWKYELLLGIRLYRLSDVRSYKPRPIGHPIENQPIPQYEETPDEYSIE